ncbi:rap1 GTPase-GDP dissociation stimulator 1-like isoform X2 [Physella acuta]|uniref:rap1 GTPase-GDP dissociation stimulator 1-like isoform X2 n=1 Tax=Physella acuta TaxID=109671 RepID=UPI0027DBCC35|nr:rap1 GTPase-GDP dissociation stimulator 1-like isoform X2 [Physella acuta]
MDNLMDLLSKMNMNDSDSLVEKVSQLIKLVCELNESESEKDKIQDSIIHHSSMDLVFKKLESERKEEESLLASCAQLIAELAKTESLREPLVDKGVIPSLLKHLTSDNISLATQVCRALGNICYDNDQARIAVEKEKSLPMILNVLSKQNNSTEDGASRLRIILCGFLLNLTNNCELLQDSAIDENVFEYLNTCLSSHMEDGDLVNMALLTIGSITESDSGKAAAIKSGLLDTFKQLLDTSVEENILVMIVDLLANLTESETAKDIAAENGLCQCLVNIVNSDAHDAELVKTASDVLVSILVGDNSMEKLYMGGTGPILLQSIAWLSSEKDTLKALGTLAIGNFARRDTYCLQLVEMGIIEQLVTLLKSSGPGPDSSFTLQHAVLSTLRNLAIPVDNKSRLFEAGVLEVCMSLIHSEVMAVVFKLLGVLRMLIEGQEAAAIKLGQERAFLDCLSDWCGVEAHAGVKGEATRVMASLVKNSRSSAVIQNLIRAEGIGHLVSMATSEHLVMQNEAILALTMIASTALAEAAIPLKEANLAETIVTLLKDEKLPAEMVCNIFSLLKSLSNAASLSVHPPCALLACTGLMPDVRRNLQEEILTSGVIDLVRSVGERHADQRVKDAAVSTLHLLEESMICS